MFDMFTMPATDNHKLKNVSEMLYDLCKWNSKARGGGGFGGGLGRMLGVGLRTNDG